MSDVARRHRELDIVDRDGLHHLEASLAKAPALAIDVETNAMYAYRAKLCFVQIATDDEILVVDTLAPQVDAGALAQALIDPSKRKVFHDAQGDLRVLAREGLYVKGVFDTHRTATLLGLPKMGLGDLVEERFGVKLAKEHQTADFGARPLPPELRAYVADDVRYLLPLAEQLEAEAKAKGIQEELELEFERLASEATEPEAPPRLKLPQGARDALGTAIAQAADRLRHLEAKERDVPVGRVLANAALAEIAMRKPANVKDLSRIPGVKGSFVRPVGEVLIAEITELLDRARKGTLTPLPKGDGQRDPRRREREEKLKAWRGEAAKARGVMPSVVLPTPLIDRLAGEPPADLETLAKVPWFGEKRLRLYGTQLVDLLRT